MSSYFTDQHKLAYFTLDFDTADAEAVLSAVAGPIDVLRVWIQLTEAASAADSVVTVGVRNASVAPGGDVTTSYGTFNIPSTGALGACYVVNVAGVDSDAVVPTGEHSQVAEVTMGRVDGYQTNLPGAIEVNPGESFVVQSNGAGTGGNAIVVVEYVSMIGKGTRGDVDAVTALTFTRA